MTIGMNSGTVDRMTSRGVMTRAVAAALAGTTDKRDAGASALARRYAALIDDATPTATYARHLRGLRAALDLSDEATEAAAEHLIKIEEALSAHSVMSDLGPKLLAALTSLGLTLAGRGGNQKGAGGDSNTKPNRLDELRSRRARKSRTGTD